MGYRGKKAEPRGRHGRLQERRNSAPSAAANPSAWGGVPRPIPPEPSSLARQQASGDGAAGMAIALVNPSGRIRQLLRYIDLAAGDAIVQTQREPDDGAAAAGENRVGRQTPAVKPARSAMHWVSNCLRRRIGGAMVTLDLA